MNRACLSAALVLAFGAGCSCALTHESDAGPGDAGDAAMEAGDGDALAAPDGRCERIGGLRRCDDACALACTAETGRCLESVGVCSRGYSDGTFEQPDSCDFGLGARGGAYCWTGLPCAASPSPLDAGLPGFAGPCMPVAFCLESGGRGLPPFQCVWSDGTPVVTGSPAGTCPTGGDPGYPFCGGVCGTVLCPNDGSSGPGGACVGVSDARGFGVCNAVSPARCQAGDVAATSSALSTCATVTASPCACLVPSPQPAGTGPLGFLVTRTACLAYRAQFPGDTDCVDETWTSLP